MRSDRDMAENILNKVDIMNRKKTQRKNIISKTAAFALALVMLAAAGITLFNGDTALTTDNSTGTAETSNILNKSFCLIVANAATATETEINRARNVSVPLGGILFVKDTSGLTEDEISRIPYEMKVKLQALYGTESGWKIHGEDGSVAVYFGTMDHIRIRLDNPDSVEKITLSCTANGQLTVADDSHMTDLSQYIQTVKTGDCITVTGEEYKSVYGKNDGMTFDWFVSETLKDTLRSAPDTALSSVYDVITGTVFYADGTQESFSLTLTFDNEGNLSTDYTA